LPSSTKSAKPSAHTVVEEPDDESGAGRARPFWSGTISFGLVTIPVELYTATRSTRSSLRMLSPNGTPLARRYFGSKDKQLDASKLERGYELDDGKFVVVTDEELEGLAPEQSRDIDLSRFVDRDSIPPLYFERAYILAPAGSSNVAYRLLASTLDRTRRAGIGRFVMRGKQYVVAIISEQGLLRAETLRFQEELRTPDSIGLPEPSEPDTSKVKALRNAMHKLGAGSPTKSELADSYWQRLEALVKKKHQQGKDVVTPEPDSAEEENLAEVIDLVSILRKSLGQNDNAKPAKSTKKAEKRVPAKKSAAKKASGVKRASRRTAKKATKKKRASSS
jgi:DNA end-binding protein Ku